MKIAATLHTIEYRGDHSAAVEIALDAAPTNTLEELLRLAEPAGRDSYHEALTPRDWITIRLVAPAPPVEEPEP